MSHSYNGPTGTRYHLQSKGSADGEVTFWKDGRTNSINMRDVLFLAALHVRGQMVEKAENSSDLQVLGLPEEDRR